MSTVKKARVKRDPKRKLLVGRIGPVDDNAMIDEMYEEDFCENELQLGVVESVKVDQYIVCEFSKKTHKFYYIGRVVKEVDDDGDIEVDFLMRKGAFFIKPTIEDISAVYMSYVKSVLPDPTNRGTTARTKGELVFSVVFGSIDLR